jgi:hypothetical protein
VSPQGYFKPGPKTTVYAQGADEQDFTNEAYEVEVRKYLAEYADVNSAVMGTATNVENAIWDSGFTLTTKLTMANFISQRKDTFVFVATHAAVSQDSDPQRSVQERSGKHHSPLDSRSGQDRAPSPSIADSGHSVP